MNTILTIDLGNGHPHGARFKEGSLLHILDRNELLGLKKDDYHSVVFSRVKKDQEIEELFQDKTFDLGRFRDENSFLDMPVHYASSLGEDRLYQSYYLFKKWKKSLLLIDSGTFTTMDIVSEEGFTGGYIFPGRTLFFDCYEKGDQLFKLEEKDILLDSINLPHTTKDAMGEAWKLYNKGVLVNILQKFSIGDVMVTGGDGRHFFDLISSLTEHVKIEWKPHLIHHALSYIYEKNHG